MNEIDRGEYYDAILSNVWHARIRQSQLIWVRRIFSRFNQNKKILLNLTQLLKLWYCGLIIGLVVDWCFFFVCCFRATISREGQIFLGTWSLWRSTLWTREVPKSWLVIISSPTNWSQESYALQASLWRFKFWYIDNLQYLIGFFIPWCTTTHEFLPLFRVLGFGWSAVVANIFWKIFLWISYD